MVKVSVNRFVSRRIETTREEVKAGTQKLRKKAPVNLEGIFRVAARIAKGEIRHQRSDRKMVPINLNQRLKWVAWVRELFPDLSSKTVYYSNL